MVSVCGSMPAARSSAFVEEDHLEPMPTIAKSACCAVSSTSLMLGSAINASRACGDCTIAGACSVANSALNFVASARIKF